jgi:hypothetical protein
MCLTFVTAAVLPTCGPTNVVVRARLVFASVYLGHLEKFVNIETFFPTHTLHKIRQTFVFPHLISAINKRMRDLRFPPPFEIFAVLGCYAAVIGS